MTRVQQRAAEKEKAILQLHELISPGDTIRTILRHVSRSGMSRSISVVIAGEDYTWLVARALGENIDRNHDGIKMGGAGMDMGFALVYRLSSILYPDGFLCTGEKDYRDGANGSRIQPCPSNDHSNGDRYYTPHHHESGGYALRHRWL